jgi:prepilin-type N-terminal cleavage/methylation domain-containing protein
VTYRLVNMIRPAEDGYSLVELIVVMAILGIVLSGLTTVFVGGSTAEAQLNHRFQAQQEARGGLDRIRTDIHCASSAQALAINTYPALRLNVTSCAGTTTYDYWCTISSSTSPVRYQLWRTASTAAPTTSTCTSTDASRVLVSNNLVSSSAFTTDGTPLNGLQTVAVDFKVSANGTSNTKELYELTDSIVARNSARCSSTSATWVSATSTCSVASVP